MTDHTQIDDPRVAALLALASAPADDPLPGEQEAVTAFLAARRPARRLHVVRPGESAKLVAAAIFGGVVVISGAAAAATHTLPLVQTGHHHSTAPKTDTPDANDDQGEDTGGAPTEDGPDSAAPTAPTTPDNGKGSEISQLAHSLPQGHKGQTICVTASQGKCHAGDATHGQSGTHGSSAAPHGQAGTAHGQAGTAHGQAGTAHGQAGTTTHGQASLPHGQAGTAHGQAGTAHGH